MAACQYSCLSYPAYKSHLFCAALHCHLQPVWLYHIFYHYLMKDTIFRNLMIVTCVLIFPTIYFLKYSYYNKNSAIYHKSAKVFM